MRISSFLLALIFSCCIQVSNAQDKLYYPSGEFIEGEVIEMRKNNLSFLKAVLPDGPVYVIEYNEIDSILFEEGIVQAMDHAKDIPAKTDFNFYKNTFAVDFIEPVFKAVEIRFERNLSERVDLVFPLYILFGRSGQGDSKIDGSVVGVVGRFYLTRKSNIRPFMDLELDLGAIGGSTAFYAFVSHVGFAYKKNRVKVAIFGGAGYGFETFAGNTASGIQLRASTLIGVNF